MSQGICGTNRALNDLSIDALKKETKSSKYVICLFITQLIKNKAPLVVFGSLLYERQ